MYTFFIDENDLLNHTHLPVADLLNDACNTDIIGFVTNLNNRVGSSYNYASGTFWTDMDIFAQSQIPKFDGLLIDTEGGDEIIISLRELAHYLEIIYTRLETAQFRDLSKLRYLLDEFEKKI